MVIAGNAQITPGEEGFFSVGAGLENADPSGVPSNVQAAGRCALKCLPALVQYPWAPCCRCAQQLCYFKWVFLPFVAFEKCSCHEAALQLDQKGCRT